MGCIYCGDEVSKKITCDACEKPVCWSGCSWSVIFDISGDPHHKNLCLFCYGEPIHG